VDNTANYVDNQGCVELEDNAINRYPVSKRLEAERLGLLTCPNSDFALKIGAVKAFGFGCDIFVKDIEHASVLQMIAPIYHWNFRSTTHRGWWEWSVVSIVETEIVTTKKIANQVISQETTREFSVKRIDDAR
jgi:hypothetical protein